MSELDHDLDALLRAAEIETEATFDDRARMRRKLAKRLGAAVITASTVGSIPAQAAPVATFKLSAWLAKGAKVATVLHGVPLAIAVGATAALPIVHAVHRTSSAPIATVEPANEPKPAVPRATLIAPGSERAVLEPAEPTTAPAPIETVVPAPAPAARPSHASSEKPAQAASHFAPAAAAAPTSNSKEPSREMHPADSDDGAALLEEYTLVARMHRALGARDAAALSNAIDEHRRRFSSGVLVEEREAMNAMLGCLRAATPEQARAIASRFVELHPRSLHAARVEASCADRAR
jgi:hypothetical protein